MSLIVSGVYKSFQQAGRTVEVLKGVDFEIPQGKCYAVLGASGSGKSTLLSLLAGLDSADRGKIRIHDKDVTSLSDSEWTQFRGTNIGIVFQQYHLVPYLTALENVLLPLEIHSVPDSRRRAEQLLEEMGLSHRMEHWPSQLSGGECQRVAIARALALNPQLVLADEPSGSLDVETGNSVMDFFFRTIRQHKMTTVLVTHNPDLAALCDGQIRLVAGRPASTEVHL